MQKINFTASATSTPYPDKATKSAHPDVVAAHKWEAARSDAQVIQEREALLQTALQKAEELAASGESARWLEGTDTITRNISQEVNGPFFEFCWDQVGLGQSVRAEYFRSGAPVTGSLGKTGVRNPTSR